MVTLWFCGLSMPLVTIFAMEHGAPPLPPLINRGVPEVLPIPRDLQMVICQSPGRIMTSGARAPSVGLQGREELLEPLDQSEAWVTWHASLWKSPPPLLPPMLQDTRASCHFLFFQYSFPPLTPPPLKCWPFHTFFAVPMLFHRVPTHFRVSAKITKSQIW